MLSTTKKLTMSLAVTIFAFVSIFGSLIFAKPAKAIPVEVLADAPSTVATVLDKIVGGLKVAVVTAAVNFVSYFMKKLAYDSAVYLASGGKGQAPLLFTDKFGDYLSDAANEAGGKAIEALGKGTGLNLCQIPDIKLDLALKVGLRTGYAGGGQTAPACTFTQMRDNWKEGASKFGESPEDMFNASLTWDQSDLGIVMNTKSTIDRISAQERKSAELERLDSGDAKAVKGLISGNVKTPSEVMSEKLKGFSGEKDKDISIGQVGQLLGSGMYQVIPSTLSVFLNTLLSQGLNNLITGFPTEDSTTDSSKVYSYTAITATGGRARAEKVFSGMLTANTKELSSYNITGDFANCPDMPGINNCVVDNKLVQAVQQANYGGTPITIKEAMASDKDWLHGSWKLIPPANTTDNTDKNCHTRAYCYSNIKKLRLANILPLGFEIAAKNSNPDKPWTLKEVVDGFNDCNYASDGVTVVPDAKNKPFCHLIDPNWVLKVPPIRCNALGYTNTLLSKAGPTRMEECVDISTCVGYDNNGNCISYGYCSRTKNTWSIAGDKCDAQYNTCISYKDTSNKIVNYLYRTLDRSGCDANNVGCQVYSLQASPGLATTTTWLPYLNKTLADLKNDKPKDIASPLVYFNSNVNTKCSAKSAGCTEFWLPNAVIDDDPFYLKKAPNYLNCYDTNTSTQTIDWPKTNSDLKKLEPNTDCKNYADVCIPDEANCNWYTQADNTSNRVPGRYTPKSVTTTIDPITGSSTYKLSWNDECSSECNGYDAYQEISSNYSAGKAVDYIVPNGTGAKTCSAQEESCSSFTNLSTTEGGLEKVEYYSYLRPCIKPDTTKEKVYYTYEGVRNSTGYQLKVYTLVENKADYSVGGKVVVPKGAPKYFFKEKSDITDYKKICSEELYKSDDIYLSSDCREFNDKDGNVYYALLAKTIAVEKSCTPYRLNSTEMYQSGTNQTKCTTQSGYWNATESKCYLCFQDGVYNNGSCIYNGLPSTANNNAGNSISCSASANTCRAYKGNSANNIEKVVVSTSSISSKKDTFENSSSTVDLYNWSGASSMTAGTWKIAVSVESTKALEHSLEFNVTNNGSNKAILQKEIPVIAGEGYVIEFWAKSNQTRMIDVKFLGGNTTLGTVQLTDQWNYFKLGPKETKNSNDKKISFEFTGNGVIYIDNLEVTRVNQLIYRVKDSLTVDKDCDLNPNDNLPGQALGCTAYTSQLYTSSGSKQTLTKYLTGFNYLCRENAIGCTGLIDTYNTDSPKAQLYNVRLLGSAGSKLSVTLDDIVYPCTVPLGETGCYIKNIPGYSPKELETKLGVGKAEITKSTVYIPADTAISSPVYLVVDGSERSTCNEIDKGCVSAGKQSIGVNGYNYSTVLIKNDPEDYSKALCQSEGVGCASYSSAEGNLYFKDPVVSGQKVCAWKENVSKSGTKYSGWFWKSVGTCGTSTSAGAITEDPATSKTYCIADTDCSKNTAGYTQCVNKDQQACYPDYVQTGNEYGLWSYGTANKYNNFVGECPTAQSGCTQFLDPNDKNKAYYLLNNEKIKTAKSACTGGVSLEAGCVLFNQTDLGNKLYSSLLTYASSKSKNYIQVPTISSSTLSGNDSNVVMKVVRDRECGEWLTCRNGESVWDTNKSKYIQKCNIIGRCNGASANSADKEINNCSSWIEDGDAELSNQILTESIYTSRDVSWKSEDFLGYSILGMYPIEELRQMNFGTDDKPDYRIVKYFYTDTPCKVADITCANKVGVCIKTGVCVQSPKGNDTSKSVKSNSTPKSCRAYPDTNAPFPFTTGYKNSVLGKQLNFCDENRTAKGGDGEDACECQYTKQSFGASSVLSKYWQYDPLTKLEGNSYAGLWERRIDDKGVTSTKPGVTTTPKGICYDAGEFEGYMCKNDEDCRDQYTKTGTCLQQRGFDNLIGLWGFCLETDKSRFINGSEDEHPCSTWYPVNHVFGTYDLSSKPESGFEPNPYGAYYCMAERGNYQYKEGYDQVTATTSPYVVLLGTILLSDYNDYGSDGKQFHVVDNVTNGLVYNSSITLKDIDYIAIDITAGTNDGTIGGTDSTSGSITGRYIIRNGGLKTGEDIVTRYGDTIDGKKTPCVIYESDGKRKNAPVINKDGKLKINSGGESCWKDDQKKELANDSNPGITSLTDSWKAETKIYKLTNGKTVARYFFDDGDHKEENLTGKADPSYRFIEDQFGWFKEIEDTLPGQSSFDTLEKQCDNDNEVAQDSEEIYILFDKNGKLEKMGAAHCSAGDDIGIGSGNYISNVKISAYLKEYCTKVVDVADNYTNKAYTNNIWEYGNLKYTKLSTQAVHSTINKPFGALNYSIKTDTVFDGLNYNNLILFSTRQDPVLKGAPYGCDGDMCGGLVTATGVVDFDEIIGYFSNNNWNETDWSLSKYLFAKSNNIYALNTSTLSNKSKELGFNVTEGDITDKLYLKAPRVRGVIEKRCSKVDSLCEEGADNTLTINGQLGGDVLIYSNPGLAIMKFYALADKDHMPIKSIKVNWGDGFSVVPKLGMFTNYRGVEYGKCVDIGEFGKFNGVCKVRSDEYLNDPTIIETKIKCEKDIDCEKLVKCSINDISANHFGVSPGACTPSYLKFTNTYSCTRTNPKFTNKCTDDASIQSKFSKGCCIFYPQVQVTDNWGWCNGVCKEKGASPADPTTFDQLSPGGDGCYNKKWYSGAPQDDQCVYEEFKSNSPWTPTSSIRVIVAPK